MGDQSYTDKCRSSCMLPILPHLWGSAPPSSSQAHSFPLTEDSSSSGHSESGLKELSPQASTFAHVPGLFAWIHQYMGGIASKPVPHGKNRKVYWDWSPKEGLQEIQSSMRKVVVMGNRRSFLLTLCRSKHLRHTFHTFEQSFSQILTFLSISCLAGSLYRTCRLWNGALSIYQA